MKKYIITLTDEERVQLHHMLSAGKAAARKLTHARILLKADRNEAPEWTDAAISAALEVTPQTVANVRQAFVEEGLEVALSGHSTRNQRGRKIDGECEAHLIALLCQPAPTGHARWTLRLLAGRMVKLEYIDSVSHETVRQSLGGNELKPWQEEEWCIPPEQNGEFVCRMEDILDIYTQPEDLKYPKVCIDELSKQLVGETRVPVPLTPGHPRRYDYEYERKGTCNIYMIFAPFSRAALGQGDRAPGLSGLGVFDAGPGRRPFPGSGMHHGRRGQPECPRGGCPVRDLRTRRGQTHFGQAGLALYAQTWQLAQHGGNRVARPEWPVLGSPDRGRAHCRTRSDGLGG